jgi:hypothetical protein
MWLLFPKYKSTVEELLASVIVFGESSQTCTVRKLLENFHINYESYLMGNFQAEKRESDG